MSTTTLERPSLRPGDQVEVRNGFDERWCPGFRVETVVREGEAFRYGVRRLSDGYVLPVLFDGERLSEHR